MAEWMPKSARPYRPTSAKPEVSGAESFARGAYQGAGMGFADEQAGALDALGGHLKRTFTGNWKNTGKGWLEDAKAEFGQVTDDYQQGRDESRRAYSEAEEANPTAYGVGQFGGAVATGIATGGASSLGKAGLKGALTAGALEGAAGGLGNSEADLTQQDMDAYARAFRDSIVGGAVGVPLAGLGYGVAKGVKAAGGWAAGALKRARGELTEGIAAERSLADDAARGLEEKEARAAAKKAATEAKAAARAKSQQEKDFRAANERTQVDKRYADPAAVPPRAGGRPARAPQAPEGPVEDPNTAILGGYRGKAGERRAVNYDRVRQYRQDIEDPNFFGDKGRLEEYARQYGDAVDNPAAFERRMVERYLRENYPPDVADRILRDRVGPGGEILPRRAPSADSQPDAAQASASRPKSPAPLPRQPFDYSEADRIIAEAQRQNPGRGPARDYSDATVERILRGEPNTQAADMGDAFRQGRGPELARQGGGGSAFGQDYPDDARTISEPLIRDLLPAANPNARRTAGTYEVPTSELDDIPVAGNRKPVAADEIRRALQRGEELPPIRVGQGPDGLRELGDGNHRLAAYRERADPYVWTQFDSDAAAQVNPNRPRGTSMFDEATAPVDSRAQAPRQPPDPFHDAPTRVGLVEVTPASDAENGLRTFEFQHPTTKKPYEVVAREHGRDPNGIYLEIIQPKGVSTDEAISPEVWARERGQLGPGIVKQVGSELSRAFPGRRVLYAERSTGANPRDAMQIRLPEVTQRMDLGDAVKQGRGDIARMGGGGSAWDGYGPEGRTINEIIPGGEFPSREAPVSMDDLRAWTDTPPVPRAAPETLPDVEELTQPGRPSFPGDARTAQPFAPRPQIREAYQPRPPAPQPYFDPAMAERRAVAAQAQAGAGGAPTRNLRPAAPPARPEPAYAPEASMNAPRDFDAETYVPQGDAMPSRPFRPSPAAPELAPEPMQVQPMRQTRPRPLAPTVGPPAQTVMGAPPGSLVRQARPSVEDEVERRIGQGWSDIGSAFARGSSGPDAASIGLGGIALNGFAGGAQGLALRGALGVAQELSKNPAARVAAISKFRLDRLARVRPEVWARVGPTLQRAMQAGPERYKAERHVLLLRDPEFRAAEAEADAELERADGQPPNRRVAGAR